MKINKTAIAEAAILQRKATANYCKGINSHKQRVEYRWGISRAGNINFIGYLTARGVEYPVSQGFEVRIDPYETGFIAYSDVREYDISQDVLKELYYLERDILESGGQVY